MWTCIQLPLFPNSTRTNKNDPSNHIAQYYNRSWSTRIEIPYVTKRWTYL